MELGQNVSTSCIPICITYNHAKFGDDINPGWRRCLQRMIKQSKSGVLKWDLAFFEANLPSEVKVIGRKQTIMSQFIFSFLFRNLIIIIVAMWERVKPEPPKEENHKVIWIILSISDYLGKLIYIIRKIGYRMHTGSIMFFLCASFTCDWVWVRLKRIKKVPTNDIFASCVLSCSPRLS